MYSRRRVQTGRPPTSEDKFYAQFGWESLRHNLDFVNDVLRQLLTINATLLGGGLLLLGDQMEPLFAKLFLMFMFLSLLSSFLGILPYEVKADVRDPAQVRQFFAAAIRWKRACTWMASALFILGFVSAMCWLALSDAIRSP